ncbi:hypothetical protein IPA_07810 [Ignicoccus pacificus DSM 13166]|uniref:HTH deoR-type domain-containing protein n=1 Tax=Ignicoccus pacificus DSM 13166 TaxID=940294 RepID=A0A977PLQ3_9CREN|nr:hypothetical protein IPA_07810 [Ignicoccus pacificus DSM 13166]
MVFWLFFRKKNKKVKKSLKDAYLDNIFEIREQLEALEVQIQRLEKRKKELEKDYIKSVRKGEKEKAAMIEQEIKSLTTKIRSLKHTRNVLEVELKKLEHTDDYMVAVTSMNRIAEALKNNVDIMDRALKPHALKVINNLENTMIRMKSADLPTPSATAVINTILEKPTSDYALPSVESLELSQPAPQSIAMADGGIVKYKTEDLAEKVYQVIQIYVKFGRANQLSVKRIAQHLGVTEAEVRKALEVLEKQGKIKIRRGKRVGEA